MEFKVGDRVRVIDISDIDIGTTIKKGSIGTILKIALSKILVEFDENIDGHNGSYSGTKEKEDAQIKVTINDNLCTGCEECVYAVPDVFEMDDNGELAEVKVDAIPEALEDAIREAADSCLAEAINIDGHDGSSSGTKGKEDHCWFVPPCSIELIKKENTEDQFKIGDSVKVIKSITLPDSIIIPKGTTGIIEEVTSHACFIKLSLFGSRYISKKDIEPMKKKKKEEIEFKVGDRVKAREHSPTTRVRASKDFKTYTLCSQCNSF